MRDPLIARELVLASQSSNQNKGERATGNERVPAQNVSICFSQCFANDDVMVDSSGGPDGDVVVKECWCVKIERRQQ